ncbi:hypothetical protein BDQ12DRAFT_727085 [Crucibulum laeve]|uniref:Uncharacterized protein n=1 Tax=Crucibulum laeve TaxID=68775 RepID=A0A5C3LZF3_9AGAR|nr:hypothetical protein BDQ12DRAFT_727085 [Crucibulum laeve]
MSANFTCSSSSAPSSNLNNSTSTPSETGSPITSDDDEATLAPRHSEQPPPVFSRADVLSESGMPMPTPRGSDARVLSPYSASTVPSGRSAVVSLAPSSTSPHQPNQA